ncbi:hypothetical protein E0X81_12830 [Halomonas sp. GDM18]|nr:hypothetical protein E0X81_12830 [Halomonas sp. GDM18]
MNSAYLKVQRAEKHLFDLVSFFEKSKPFGYFLEINYKTGGRATFAKRNAEVANEAALIIGDVLHNLRASLDHAYWDCTEKYAKSDGERRQIQFPIVSTHAALRDSVLPGLPVRVSHDFALALEGLRPYRENGNILICAIHDLDVLDKHKLLVPTGNFTRIDSEMIRKLVPDFPQGLSDCGFGDNHRDVGWRVNPMSRHQRRRLRIPPSSIVEQELEVPVDIVLHHIDSTRPTLEVLQELVRTTKHAISVLYSGAEISVD